MPAQLDLFNEVELEKPEPQATVRLGNREARIPLRKQRRQAARRFMEIITELMGKDIYIGSYHTGGSHFWIDNLKLGRLELELYPIHLKYDVDYIPSVIVLWGNKGGHVRIFTDYLVAVREQEYEGYWHYLLDFRNGFYESRIDQWRSNYAYLAITRFKD
ncbi:unnamed protein product [marine sediment metagenome]|uniref:Uncharacterized protein n=1 Tax=marine sediment metagenome TaxID=412755 RepID=X1VV03_9ZZZZ